LADLPPAPRRLRGEAIGRQAPGPTKHSCCGAAEVDVPCNCCRTNFCSPTMRELADYGSHFIARSFRNIRSRCGFEPGPPAGALAAVYGISFTSGLAIQNAAALRGR